VQGVVSHFLKSLQLTEEGFLKGKSRDPLLLIRGKGGAPPKRVPVS